MTRILLIEDNPGDAIIFREKLNASDLDYELVHAKRLGEGLDTLRERAFDILLVDLSLPDAQGLEAVTRVREATPDCPLIVLTGLDDATAAAEAKKQGAVDYLVKWYVDSVSLARYIRYAIAQYQMFESSGADDTGVAGAPRRPSSRRSQTASEGQVVEGKLVRPSKVAGTEPEVEPEQERKESPEAVAEVEPPDALRGALAAAETALVIVTEQGNVAFASETAREWVPADTYPWPVEEGVRRIPRKGRPLEQRASRTTWRGEAAFLVTLRSVTPEPAAPESPPPPTPASNPPSDVMLLRSAKAALAFVEHAEQWSAWMADVLRCALDLHRLTAGDVDVQPEDLDVYELAQQVVREQRPLAMRLGLPLSATSPRKKVIAYVDRNLASALLHRLVVDAVQAAGPDGVELRVEVEPNESVVEVAWTESSRSADPAVEACGSLGQGLVERIVAMAEGESQHERTKGGQHTVTVRLPCRSAE